MVLYPLFPHSLGHVQARLPATLASFGNKYSCTPPHRITNGICNGKYLDTNMYKKSHIKNIDLYKNSSL